MRISMIMLVLLRCVAFIAGACYLADGHPKMAAWCIFGAIVGGINLNIGANK